MNERIRELIREAESTTNEGIGFEGQEYLDMLMERFAESIVQECVELTLDHKNDDYYNGWLDYRDEIKRHFGVEK
jgi:hypothetical protein